MVGKITPFFAKNVVNRHTYGKFYHYVSLLKTNKCSDFRQKSGSGYLINIK